MREIKNEIAPNADGSYTITDAHSTADVVRWLLTQDTKETIMYLLGEEAKDESKKMSESWASHGGLWIEDLWKHQEKNT
jgi:hypothetical protein